MKLKKLIIDNIASIEHAEIDFDAAPLAGEHLFLINGETGSGKSTIIDCLCLALYGDTPRLNNARSNDYTPNRQEGSSQDSLKTNDVRQLLRRGAISADVKLTFDDDNGTPYIATWHVHHKHRKIENRIMEPERTLCTDDTAKVQVHKEGSRQINNHIIELLGLDINQFFRTVVLAQGKFAEFLNSVEDDKAKLLEKMTGTQIYADMGMKIYQTCKAKENERNLLCDQLKNITLLNDEDKQHIIKEIDELKTQQSKHQQQRDGAQKMSDWLDEKNSNDKKLADTKATLDEKKALTLQQEHQEQLALISDWEGTTDARQELKAMHEAGQHLKALELERPVMQEEFDRLSAALRATITDLDNKRQSLDEIQAFLKREEPNRGMYSAIDTIKSVMERRHSANQNITTHTEAVEQEQGHLPQAEEAVKQALNACNDIKQALKQMQEEYDGLHIDQVNANKDHLTTAKQDLMNYKNVLETTAQAQRSLDKLKQDLDSQQSPLHEAQAAIVGKRALLENVQAAVERQKDWNTLIEQAHKTLHEGDQCPVCGNVIHTLLAPKAQSELDQLQAQCRKAEQDVIDAETKINAAKKFIAHLNDQISEDEKALQRKTAECEKQRKQVDASLGRCGKAIGETVTVEGVQGLITEIDHDITRLNGVIMQAQTLNNRIKQQHNESTKATEAHNKALIDLGSINANIDKHREAINANKKQFNELTNELDKLLVFNDWQERAKDTEFISTLARQANDYKAKEREAQQLEHTIELTQSHLPAMNTAKANTKGFEDHGHTTAEIPKDLDKLWNTFENKSLEWNTRMDTEHKNHQRAELALEDFLSHHPAMTMERLNLLARQNQSEILEIKRAHQALGETITLLQGEMKALTKRQEEIAAKKPPFTEENPERLAAIIQEADNLIKNLNEDISSRAAQLKLDEENVRLVGEKKEALEKAEAIYTRWADFNNMLGDSTGNKFGRIAQSFILGELLHKANDYLRRFNNRYELEAKPGTLVILARDTLQGGLTSVNTLSGGESFMVSLALALALSSTTGKLFSVDTLFIDEGFGSLSPDYIGSVMVTLNQLYDMGGRRVGIISHVKDLMEHVTTYIEVKRDGKNNTVSNVTVKTK